MIKTIILLAGYPGTGKTYLGERIIEKQHSFMIVSQDDIKEYLFDKDGFNNAKEKQELIAKARKLYYENLEEKMKEGEMIITDYPFSDIQKPIFESLASKYSYQVITIRLVGDLDIIFKRRIARDLKTDRHLGHIVSCYHKGDELIDRSKASELITYDDFIKVCETKKYGEFELGHLIEVDMSDFSKVNYEELVSRVMQLL